MQISQGMTIAGFRLDELIGEGGMGVVYKARQLDLDRVVALKLIQPTLSDSNEFRDRFQRESRLAASIDHPNIVPVFQAGEEQGVYFIAMRYVDGTDLGEYLRSRKAPLEPVASARLIAEVADGLDAAHQAGLVHRDVKPANVLLDSRLHPYLTDFGLTKQISSQSLNTKTGIWLGSINYSAPEQIEGQPVDARTDVYALGCVLFEALTRRLPYARDSEMALMYAKVHNEPLLPSEVDPQLPSAFDEVIRRALARRPQDRFPSAGNLGAAALAAAQGVADVAPERTVARGAASSTNQGYEPTRATPLLESSTQVMEQRRSSRNWLALGAGLLAVLAILALSVVVLLSSDSRHPSSEATTQTKRGAQGDGEAAASAANSSSPESTQNSAAPSPVAAETTTAPAAVPLEDFRGNLYAAQVPAGWTAETIESHESTYYESQWRDPNDSNTSVLIDSQLHNADSTALEDAEGVRSETSQSTGYREVAFEATTLQGQPAARWVFEVEEDRRVDYFVISCGVGIAVLGSTSPADFGGWAPTFHAVANSITPLCE